MEGGVEGIVALSQRRWVEQAAKGITSKALGAEEQTLCRSSDCWSPVVAARIKKGKGKEC